jgi:hypothetical protein
VLLEATAILWFCASAIALIGYSIALRLWLDRRGVSVDRLLAGMPPYLEKRYRDYCAANHVPAGARGWLGRVLLLNAIVAAIVLAVCVGPRATERAHGQAERRIAP